MLGVNEKAPEFKLNVTADQKVSLSELRGRKVILAFYPADFSPVCSDQLSLINQGTALFEKYGANPIAISVDGVWAHQAFAKECNFHFPLLADFEPKGEVARLYGVYDEENGISKRAIFIIDEEGIIQWSYLSPMGVNPGIDGILDALDRLQKEGK